MYESLKAFQASFVLLPYCISARANSICKFPLLNFQDVRMLIFVVHVFQGLLALLATCLQRCYEKTPMESLLMFGHVVSIYQDRSDFA